MKKENKNCIIMVRSFNYLWENKLKKNETTVYSFNSDGDFNAKS